MPVAGSLVLFFVSASAGGVSAAHFGGLRILRTLCRMALRGEPGRPEFKARRFHTPVENAIYLLGTSATRPRPQLSQAFRRLYGTAQHKGILAGLAILKLYCECLGTTWTGNPDRDPVVFFRTSDMADTSRWQRLPAEFDKDQAKAYSFTRPDHSTNRISDRSSGLGPVNGRPP